MTLHLRNQKGFSLLELLLSIAIISLIILMATRYFSSVRSNQKASEAISLIQGIRGGVSSLKSTNPSSTVDIPALCNYNQIPKSYCTGTPPTIVPPIGTGFTMTTVGSTDTNFTITIANVPDAGSCNSICSAFANDTTSPMTCSTTCSPTATYPLQSLDLMFNV